MNSTPAASRATRAASIRGSRWWRIYQFWDFGRNKMIVRMPDGSVAVMAHGARADVYRPGGGVCARGVMPEGWGALGRGDGMVRCQGRGLAPGAAQAVISRRKTIRAVIIRTIIDGTTDMRESPDWIVLSMMAGDGFDQAPSYRAFWRTRRSMGASSPVWQQGGPRRARYDCLSNSSKLRQSLARRVNEWLTWDWANTARPGSRRGRRGEGEKPLIWDLKTRPGARGRHVSATTTR